MKSHLQELLRAALQPVIAGTEVRAPDSIQIDAAKDKSHGDFASNLALILAKPLGKSPRAVAELLVKNLPASPSVAKVEIAGPDLVATVRGDDAYQVLDGLVEKLDEQLRERHERRKDKRNHPRAIELEAELPKMETRTR